MIVDNMLTCKEIKWIAIQVDDGNMEFEVDDNGSVKCYYYNKDITYVVLFKEYVHFVGSVRYMMYHQYDSAINNNSIVIGVIQLAELVMDITNRMNPIIVKARRPIEDYIDILS